MDKEELLALLKAHLQLDEVVKPVDRHTEEVTITLSWRDDSPEAENYLTEITSTTFYVGR